MSFTIEQLREVAEARGQFLLVVRIKDEFHGFIIPSAKCSLDDMIDSLTDENWATIGVSYEEEDISIYDENGEDDNIPLNGDVDWTLSDFYIIDPDGTFDPDDEESEEEEDEEDEEDEDDY